MPKTNPPPAYRITDSEGGDVSARWLVEDAGAVMILFELTGHETRIPRRTAKYPAGDAYKRKQALAYLTTFAREVLHIQIVEGERE